MPLTYANQKDKNKGWTLDCVFLKEIQQRVEKEQVGDDTPSLEQIEDVLLAYENLK